LGDNEQVGDVTPDTERGWLGQARDFVRSTEPRKPMSRRSVAADIVLAGSALTAAVALAVTNYHGYRPALVFAAALLATVPLAARRRYPLAAFLVLAAGVLATRDYATDVTFVAVVIAAFSAAVHGRFRGAALLSVAPVGVLVGVDFWNAHAPGSSAPPRSAHYLIGPVSSRHWATPVPAGTTPWRVAALLVLVSLVSIAVVGAVAYAGDRIRRLQAEHSAATQRAIELERARIAGELHDVVTHNVSVMIVQAGAARQVLAEAPGEARTALLAVEASGRAAMAELRHMLGLLSPATGGGDPGGSADATSDPQLTPQPGLGELRSLVGRLTSAGLPVQLDVGDLPQDLPPGQDLAAFRVVQEALTNVIKHAGKPPTRVGVHYRDGSLELEVADTGRPIPAATPATAPGSGRGLIGLRERVGVYGGEFEAGPQPVQEGGGWLVRARIPVAPAASRGEPLAAIRP
jgi:signal transduction histidine kinase